MEHDRVGQIVLIGGELEALLPCDISVGKGPVSWLSNPTLWFRYAKVEIKHHLVNHDNNIWDQVVPLLPHIKQPIMEGQGKGKEMMI